jgi:hypothetical protein
MWTFDVHDRKYIINLEKKQTLIIPQIDGGHQTKPSARDA